MNVVEFWKEQTALWNEQSKCGFCWEFSAPLTESAVNIVQPSADKACCVQLMVLRDKQPAFSTSNTYNQQTGFLNQQTCNNAFQLLVLMPSNIGVNNYNEIKNHPTSESKWETILQRLEDCLSCDANLAFCEVLGSQYKVTQWSGMQVINYLDSMYCGYRISINFQKSN